MSQGVLVGCDRNQEWLLPWWWEHYSRHNAYPVAFMDFGMSEEGKTWCRHRGQYLRLKPTKARILGKNQLPPATQSSWENHYGRKIWSRRRIWFKKPFALLQSPFEKTIWLDLDCQVRKSLEPLFICLVLGADIALKRDSEEIQRLHRSKHFILPEETNYDCGLIAYCSQAPILSQWVEEIVQRNQNYVFDQQALSRALMKYPHSLFELPESSNWSAANGPNSNALVYHFHGGSLKQMLKEPPEGAFWI